MTPAASPPASAAGWEPWLGATVARVERPAPTGGPLAGLRLGVKEILDVAGVVTSCGAPSLVPGPPATADAPAVARLVAAGARLVATTATHPFAYGIVTPQTRNPRARERVAGGSSGGAAAGLAAGLWDVAVGTDTGGSCRIPAACCGVVGLKPTFGRVPLDGVHPLAPSLDTVGALARDVAVCRAAFHALAGPGAAGGGGPGGGGAASAGPLRVGLVRELRTVGLDDDVRAVWEAVLDDLRVDGADVVGVALPSFPSAGAANGRILAAEALAVHAERLAAFPNPARWPADVRARLDAARDLDPGLVASARRLRARWRREVADVLAAVDVLVTPTLPCRVPRVGEDPVAVAGRPQPVTAALTRLCNPWNLAGVPAGSVPAGTDGGGAPVGVQVIGPAGGEETVLDVMARIERLRGGPLPPVRL